MAYFHFLIDLSQSNQAFQQQLIFQRLIDQIDQLMEYNQLRESKDVVGYTFFANGILRREIEFPLADFRDLVREPLSYHPGSAVLDAIAKTSSLLEEHLKDSSMKKNLLIFSDFEENASSFYTVESLGETINELSNRCAWDFYAFGLKKSQEAIFLGMNFNLNNLIFLPD
jgi:hypothetical protein